MTAEQRKSRDFWTSFNATTFSDSEAESEPPTSSKPIPVIDLTESVDSDDTSIEDDNNDGEGIQEWDQIQASDDESNGIALGYDSSDRSSDEEPNDSDLDFVNDESEPEDAAGPSHLAQLNAMLHLDDDFFMNKLVFF